MNVRSRIQASTLLGIVCSAITSQAIAAGWDPDSTAPNTGSITNTRHNLSLSYMLISSGNPKADGTSELGYAFMGITDVTFAGAMNNYGEVCVYCHTPHGSNAPDLKAPLWNHTMNTVAYTPYTTLTGNTGTPGPNSLMCLSCHDGTTAIDSVINMPGSDRYEPTNAFNNSINSTFLDSWNGTPWNGHVELSSCGDFTGCHGSTAPDFTVFNLGKDLTNDHPVGLAYPTTNIEFKPLTVSVPGRWAYIEPGAGDGKLQKSEVRLYDAASGDYRVECSSCHDPHGVTGGDGFFIPGFLRVDNNGSALCYTCHDK